MDWENHIKRNYNEQFIDSFLENTSSFSRPSDDLSGVANHYIFTNKSLTKYNRADRIYDVDNPILPKLYRKHQDVEQSKHNKDFYTKIPNSTRLGSKIVDDSTYDHKCECFRNKLSLNEIRLNKILRPNEFWDYYKDYDWERELYPLQSSFMVNASVEQNIFILLNLDVDIKSITLSMVQRYDWNENFMGNREMVLIVKKENAENIAELLNK